MKRRLTGRSSADASRPSGPRWSRSDASRMLRYDPPRRSARHADVAQLVERDLPKVDVASSSLVIRSESYVGTKFRRTTRRTKTQSPDSERRTQSRTSERSSAGYEKNEDTVACFGQSLEIFRRSSLRRKTRGQPEIHQPAGPTTDAQVKISTTHVTSAPQLGRSLRFPGVATAKKRRNPRFTGDPCNPPPRP